MPPAEGISLHIGLNRVDPDHYAGWSGPLNACVADAEDVADIARVQGFEAQLLTNHRATRDAVREAITAAAERLAPGGTFWLTYSGHGGQVPDESYDEAGDFTDETWCLYDGQLIDDELLLLWSFFEAGTRVLVLSDSCHSGTITRDALDTLVRESDVAGGESLEDKARKLGVPLGRFRDLPPAIALGTYRANRGFYRRLSELIPFVHDMPEVKARVRLISACQDAQVALDGTFNGLFTAAVLRTWRNGLFAGDHETFYQALLALMPPTQKPNHYIFGAADAAFDAMRPFSL